MGKDNIKPIKHIAFIMDGNGRWAKSRLLDRSSGHKKGVSIIKEIVESAFDDHNIYAVSLFTFSTENWNRPASEIKILFKLLKEFFTNEIEHFKNRGTQIRVLGDLEDTRIPKDILKVINDAMDKTKDCSKNVFNVLFNYGSRNEIINATKKIAIDVQEKKINIKDINKDIFDQYLYTKELSDIDLLIRTSGEERLSNCLLYQVAYAEFIFNDKYWPDYTKEELSKDIDIYYHRNRRFGAIK